MLDGILISASTALAISLAVLLVAGAHWRGRGLFLVLPYGCAIAALAYVGSEALGGTPRHEWLGPGLVLAVILAAALLRRDWNPAAQALLGILALTCALFVALAGDYVVSGGLSAAAMAASLALMVLEVFALVLLLMSTHEVLDVVGRVRWRRKAGGAPLGSETPFVSIQVPISNEPPEVVKETLRTLRHLRYPAYEVLVLDNNTDDERLWRPVERACRRPGFRFFHLVDWPGFKAGALNHGLEAADPRTEIVAVVDADFQVDWDFLARTVGYFTDPQVGIVQTAQGFRYEGATAYPRTLALAYRAFDEITMPPRNERNAAIFAGTMGLIRKRALDEAGGWDESCLTEDAEVSLRILARGYDSVYVEREFGRGLLPPTFASLKRQRFRWCFGGMQILRRHWRLLLLGRDRGAGGARLRLSVGQRYEFLVAGLQWFQSLVSVGFAGLVATAILFRALGSGLEMRPLAGLFVAVPALFFLTGLLKAWWGLRARLHVSSKAAVGVVGIWLALTWVVAMACVWGLSRAEGIFRRTPRGGRQVAVWRALRSVAVEAPLALLLAAAVVLGLREGGAEGVFLALLCAWSAAVFLAAPITALVAARDVRVIEGRTRRVSRDKTRRVRRYGWQFRFALATVAAALVAGFAGASLGVTRDGGREADEPRTSPRRTGTVEAYPWLIDPTAAPAVSNQEVSGSSRD